MQQHVCEALQQSSTAKGLGCARTSTMLPQKTTPLLGREQRGTDTTALCCRGGKEGSRWPEWEGNQGKSAAPDTGEAEEAEDVNADEVLVKKREGGRREGADQQQISTAGQEMNPSHTSPMWGQGPRTREKHSPKNT